MTDGMTLEPITVVDEGLGNTCYLLDLGDSTALVVDPPRDVRAVRGAAAEAGLRIRFAADTHLHADFLSGAVQLAHDEGAQVLASRAGRREFAHRGLADGDEVDLGGLLLTALATPGHTDEHLSFLVSDGGVAAGVFTGGSLIVGSAARTDLLGSERAEALARAQFRSLQRLTRLPGATAVWPTHGAGSFCSAPPGAERTSTIGRERAGNPLLRAPDADAFVAALLGSLGSYPPYFRLLAERNRRGPAVLGAEAGQLAALPAPQVRRLVAGGAVVVDIRPVDDWAAAHVTGSLSIPLRGQFATWLGWLVMPDVPVVLVRNAEQDPAEAVWQALKIGHEEVAGELAGGIPGWIAAGGSTSRSDLVPPDRIGHRRVLDVRQRAEFTGGHLPGASHVELGAVADAAARLAPAPTVVMCGHGERAATAVSMLERSGHHGLAVLVGGPQEWARSTGGHLETSP